MPTQGLRRGANLQGIATGTNAPIYVDSADNKAKMVPAGSGTTKVELIDASSAQTLTNKTLTSPTLTTPVLSAPIITAPIATIAGDGAIPITSGSTYLTKGSAAAITVAAPGASGIGVVLDIVTGSDFAHVVTFTGSTLNDGTTGAKVTWTSAAFKGSAIRVIGVTATQWLVLSKNLGTVA